MTILLTAYDAKRCARRVHNEADPSIETEPVEVPPEVQLRFDAGRDFEATVFAALRASVPADELVDLTEVRGKADVVAATTAAMAAQTPAILGGWLPDDTVAGRTGRPDLLLHVGDGAYVPGEVKGHLMLQASKARAARLSALSAPLTVHDVEGLQPRVSQRFDDHLQLAHYWRMLEAMGRSGATPSGFVIGTDRRAGPSGTDLALTWLDLTGPLFETYSRTRGTAMRSALERYDHEFDFRAKVAAAAARGAPALVEPIFTDECDSCPWYDFCRDLAPDDTASAHVTSGRLGVREWRALAAQGVRTVDELVELDLGDAEFESAYLAEVSTRRPLDRLALAQRRARMARDGVSLERETTGAIELPRFDVEIDFDVEWDAAEQVYLWGALVSRRGAAPSYRPFVSWAALDKDSSAALGREFAAWLRAEIAAATEAGQTLAVYHYTAAERTQLRSVLGAEADDLLEHFVDLHPIVKEHYFGANGLGVKKVAPAFGFCWRDETPGGLQSQVWLLEARGPAGETATSAQSRILAYNEDDVRATAAIREGMRESAE